MVREEEVRETVLNIMADGLLMIRMLGQAGRAAECALEADHLHNLPQLALKPSVDMLSFYLKTSRPHYERGAKQTEHYRANWKCLEELAVANGATN